jgi:hypothetical protein
VNPPEGVVYRPLVWSLCVLFGAAGFLLMVEMLSSVIGPFRFGELGARDPRSHVAIWSGAAGPQGAGPLLARFRTWLGDGGEVHPIDALATLDPERVGAVVLSEPRTLGPNALAALERYLAAGGGVVVTGSFGVRDAAGAWRGYDLMRRLLGTEVTPLPAATAVALAPGGRGPLSAPLAPGEVIAVRPEPGLPSVAASGAELRWADGSGATASAAPVPAAALRRSVGAGRLVWLAIGPERAATEAGSARLAAVLGAALAWAERRPALEVLAWPGGAPFAATVERVGADAPDDPGAGPDALAAVVHDAEAVGGLARLPEPLAPPDHGPAASSLQGVLAGVARRGGWVASRTELTAWVLHRSSLHATLRRVGPRRLVVAVTNHASEPADGVALRVYLNEPARSATVEPTALLQDRPGLRLRAGAEFLDLVLPTLAGRRSTAFTVDYETVGDG